VTVGQPTSPRARHTTPLLESREHQRGSISPTLRRPDRRRYPQYRLGFGRVLLLILALTPVRALLALVAIPIALAFDALFLYAELVSVAIIIVLACFDALVLLAN
jgi:hypothetical protein